jgi:hypothetical protein
MTQKNHYDHPGAHFEPLSRASVARQVYSDGLAHGNHNRNNAFHIVVGLARLADCFGVGGVVLLSIHKRFEVRRRDRTYVVPYPTDLARPVMRAAAGFHRDHNAAVC